MMGPMSGAKSRSSSTKPIGTGTAKRKHFDPWRDVAGGEDKCLSLLTRNDHGLVAGSGYGKCEKQGADCRGLD